MTLSLLGATQTDRVGAEFGSETMVTRGSLSPSNLATSFVEGLSPELSGTVAGASLPLTGGTVVAGFTPTVASITEQNSLELLDTPPDSVAETPPQRLVWPKDWQL